MIATSQQHGQPAALTPADFQAWIAANDDLSPRTLAHYLSSIRQVLDFCDVTPNPARSPKVKLPSDTAAEVEAPNTKEWQAIKRHGSAARPARAAADRGDRSEGVGGCRAHLR